MYNAEENSIIAADLQMEELLTFHNTTMLNVHSASASWAPVSGKNGRQKGDK